MRFSVLLAGGPIYQCKRTVHDMSNIIDDNFLGIGAQSEYWYQLPPMLFLRRDGKVGGEN